MYERASGCRGSRSGAAACWAQALPLIEHIWVQATALAQLRMPTRMQRTDSLQLLDPSGSRGIHAFSSGKVGACAALRPRCTMWAARALPQPTFATGEQPMHVQSLACQTDELMTRLQSNSVAARQRLSSDSKGCVRAASDRRRTLRSPGSCRRTSCAAGRKAWPAEIPVDCFAISWYPAQASAATG